MASFWWEGWGTVFGIVYGLALLFGSGWWAELRAKGVRLSPVAMLYLRSEEHP